MKKLISPVVVLNILAIVLFIIILWFGSQRWMNHFTHHGEGIEVPQLIGMSVMDAEDELYVQELECLIVDSVYDKSRPAGTILDQKPEAGAMVKRGRQIYLTVNKSAMDKQPLPRVIGNCTEQQARELLLKNGFILGATEYTYGEKDMVLSIKARGMSVGNGQYISPDVPLTLVVGNTMTESNEYNQSYDDMDAWGEEELMEDDWANEYEI